MRLKLLAVAAALSLAATGAQAGTVLSDNFDSENGGATAEVLLSIISTCKRHKVEPTSYLRAVIEQLIRDPSTDLEKLLPHTWNHRVNDSDAA